MGIVVDVKTKAHSILLEKLVSSGVFMNGRGSTERAVSILKGLTFETPAGVVIIDPEPAQEGAHLMSGKDIFSDGWVGYFNKQKKGMISTPHLYLAGKYASDSGLDVLREEMRNHSLATSTKVVRDVDAKYSYITHNAGSKIFSPVKKKVSIASRGIESGLSLNTFAKARGGPSYLQALFDTEDEARTIVQVLEHLFNQRAKNINVYLPHWTMCLQGEEKRETHMVFSKTGVIPTGDYSSIGEYGHSRHNITCDPSGHSRGVTIVPKKN